MPPSQNGLLEIPGHPPDNLPPQYGLYRPRRQPPPPSDPPPHQRPSGHCRRSAHPLRRFFL